MHEIKAVGLFAALLVLLLGAYLALTSVGTSQMIGAIIGILGFVGLAAGMIHGKR